jgi:poly(hydroxyalkanoate) depolymerase family esterase
MPDTPRDTAARSAGMQEEMAEATRLPRAGRLDGATALIQRALGGGISPAYPAGSREAAWGASPLSPSDLLPGGVRPPGINPDLLRAPEPGVARAERFVAGSFTNRAGTRGYKLYIPSGAEGRDLPLVVMLHGCTQGADDLAAGTRMNELAVSGSYFVVYPEQSAGANGQRCWNWFKADEQRRDRGEPSIIAGITRKVATTQPVDLKRIYVAGMSAGAAMAVILGAPYPDLYAAVGVHSGLPYGAAHDMPSAFAAMKGRAGARAARTPIPPSPTPRPRWCVSSWSTRWARAA